VVAGRSRRIRVRAIRRDCRRGSTHAIKLSPEFLQISAIYQR
jgi:hypothetical protein